MRTVICHYHIYKNSGTSFDKLLKKNFGAHHLAFDGPFPFFSIDQEQLSRIIQRRRDIIAFSSHQIGLPVPPSLDFLILPVVFIRHPVLRIFSIYKFKRNHYDGTTTSKAAQEKNFNEWVQHCFTDKQEIVHISNAQTRMLGAAYRQKPLIKRRLRAMEYDIHQALRNIENIQLLARTEFFNKDVGGFSEILSEYGIDFKFVKIKPQNVTSDDHHKSVGERLEKVKQLLSQENYKKMRAANSQDFFLYNYISKLIEDRQQNTSQKAKYWNGT